MELRELGGRAATASLRMSQPAAETPLRCQSATSALRCQTARSAKGLPARAAHARGADSSAEDGSGSDATNPCRAAGVLGSERRPLGTGPVRAAPKSLAGSRGGARAGAHAEPVRPGGLDPGRPGSARAHAGGVGEAGRGGSTDGAKRRARSAGAEEGDAASASGDLATVSVTGFRSEGRWDSPHHGHLPSGCPPGHLESIEIRIRACRGPREPLSHSDATSGPPSCRLQCALQPRVE